MDDDKLDYEAGPSDTLKFAPEHLMVAMVVLVGGALASLAAFVLELCYRKRKEKGLDEQSVDLDEINET